MDGCPTCDAVGTRTHHKGRDSAGICDAALEHDRERRREQHRRENGWYDDTRDLVPLLNGRNHE